MVPFSLSRCLRSFLAECRRFGSHQKGSLLCTGHHITAALRAKESEEWSRGRGGRAFVRRETHALSNQRVSVQFTQAAWYSTARHTLYRHRKTGDGVEVTVTPTTLFADLMRLFPCSAAYLLWRESLGEERTDCVKRGITSNGTHAGCMRCNGRSVVSAFAAADSNFSFSSPSRFTKTSPVVVPQPPQMEKGIVRTANVVAQGQETYAPTLNAVSFVDDLSDDLQTGGYDWRFLFLVRYTPSTIFAAEHSDIEHRCESPAGSDSQQQKEGSARRMLFSSEMPQTEITEEGRAVRLWEQLALSTGSSVDNTGTAAQQSAELFCWSQPATYTLYYWPSPMVSDTSSELVNLNQSDSGNKKRKPRNGCGVAALQSSGRNRGSETASLRNSKWQEVKREDLYRVGELHAIPGLPQPAPITLPFSSPQQSSSNSVAYRDYSDEVIDAAVHEALAAALLTGSVCSLHDYNTQLCESGGSKLKKGSVEGSASRVMVRHTPAAASTEKISHRTVNPAQKRIRHQEKTAGEATPAQSSSAITTPSSGKYSSVSTRFPFPVFFGHDTTKRGDGKHSTRHRWATCPRINDSRRRDAVEQRANHNSERNQRDASQLRISEIDSEGIYTIPQPSLPFPIPPSDRHARHWNCVPSSVFLSAFVGFHSLEKIPDENALGSGKVNEVDWKKNKGVSPNHEGLCEGHDATASPLCATEQVVQDHSVGVLLVHEHEWIYFTLLFHVHPTRAKQPEPLSNETLPCARSKHSESLSFYYCFLHPPCRLSRQEMEELARRRPLDAGHQPAQRLTLPHTWLVHLSTEVRLQGLVNRLWEVSGLDVSETGVAEERSVSDWQITSGSLGSCLASSEEVVAKQKHISSFYRKTCPHPIATRDDETHEDFLNKHDQNSYEDYDDWRLGDSNRDNRDIDAGYTRAACAALHRKRVHLACEVELLRRYLEHTLLYHSQTSVPRNHACQRAQQRQSALATTQPLTKSSKDIIRFSASQVSKVSHHRGRFIAVSPFPRRTDLIKNCSWYSKPYVLAEEMKYGTAVRYNQAMLAVPRAR